MYASRWQLLTASPVFNRLRLRHDDQIQAVHQCGTAFRAEHCSFTSDIIRLEESSCPPSHKRYRKLPNIGEVFKCQTQTQRRATQSRDLGVQTNKFASSVVVMSVLSHVFAFRKVAASASITKPSSNPMNLWKPHATEARAFSVNSVKRSAEIAGTVKPAKFITWSWNNLRFDRVHVVSLSCWDVSESHYLRRESKCTVALGKDVSEVPLIFWDWKEMANCNCIKCLDTANHQRVVSNGQLSGQTLATCSFKISKQQGLKEAVLTALAPEEN